MNFKKLEPVVLEFLGYDNPGDKIKQEASYKLLRDHLSNGMPDLIVTKISRKEQKITTEIEGKNCRVYTVEGFKTNNPKAR